MSSPLRLPLLLLLIAACRAPSHPAPLAASAPLACPRSPDASGWVRDCNAPWKREYWRVFTRTVGKTTVAALMPRPDFTPAMFTLCKAAEMKAIVERYGWCPRDGAVDVDRVNAMTLDDALAMAHWLHRDLKFVGGDAGVWPYPRNEDIATVCVSPRTPDVEAGCAAFQHGLEIQPFAPKARAVARELNKLYGIR